MNYFVHRQDQRYGPYTEADIRRFLASGHVHASDLVSSDAEPEPKPAGHLLGAPSNAIPSGAYLPAYQKPQMANGAPLPPNLHWGLVLLLSFLTCGFFPVVWILMQAWWVRQIRPGNRAIKLLVASFCINYAGTLILSFFGSFAGAMPRELEENPVILLVAFGLAFLVTVVGIGFFITGELAMRDGMIEYFRSVENTHLELNALLTALFGVFYLQFHMSQIAERKRSGSPA